MERRSAALAIGQRSYFIQGRVFDAASNEPVNQAAVSLTRLGGAPLQQTITDSMGNFFFSNLNPGTYEVEVRAQGYRDSRESIQLTVGPNSGVFINLQPRQEVAKPVVIEPLSAEEQQAPEAAKDRYKKGVEAYRERRLEESRANFEEAIRLFPRFASAHSGLGIVLLQLGDVAGAQAGEGIDECLSKVGPFRPVSQALALMCLTRVWTFQLKGGEFQFWRRNGGLEHKVVNVHTTRLVDH